MATTETNTVSLRLPVEMAEFLTERGEGSINQGVKNSIDKLKAMERYAELSLRGVFTQQEWMALADNMNGTIVKDPFRYDADSLIAHINDGDNYEGLCEKWGVSLTLIRRKVKNLHPIEIEALYRRIEYFWEHSQEIDLETWSIY